MLGRPGEECPTEDLLGNGPFISTRGLMGVQGRSGLLRIQWLKHRNTYIEQKQTHDMFTEQPLDLQHIKDDKCHKNSKVYDTSQTDTIWLLFLFLSVLYEQPERLADMPQHPLFLSQNVWSGRV